MSNSNTTFERYETLTLRARRVLGCYDPQFCVDCFEQSNVPTFHGGHAAKRLRQEGHLEYVIEAGKQIAEMRSAHGRRVTVSSYGDVLVDVD